MTIPPLPGDRTVSVYGDRLAPNRLIHVLGADRLRELTAGDVAADRRPTELSVGKGRRTGRGIGWNHRRARCRGRRQDGSGPCFSLWCSRHRLCSGACCIVVQGYRAEGSFRDGEQQNQRRRDDSGPSPAASPSRLRWPAVVFVDLADLHSHDCCRYAQHHRRDGNPRPDHLRSRQLTKPLPNTWETPTK